MARCVVLFRRGKSISDKKALSCSTVGEVVEGTVGTVVLIVVCLGSVFGGCI